MTPPSALSRLNRSELLEAPGTLLVLRGGPAAVALEEPTAASPDPGDPDLQIFVAVAEDGSVTAATLGGINGVGLFELLKDAKQGFHRPRLRMIGFPGVRHDHIDWMTNALGRQRRRPLVHRRPACPSLHDLTPRPVPANASHLQG